jgi:hypothetical protein
MKRINCPIAASDGNPLSVDTTPIAAWAWLDSSPIVLVPIEAHMQMNAFLVLGLPNEIPAGMGLNYELVVAGCETYQGRALTTLKNDGDIQLQNPEDKGSYTIWLKAGNNPFRKSVIQREVSLASLVVPTGKKYFRPYGTAMERFTVIGCSDFNLYSRFLKNEDITPVLEQRQALGYNLKRIWSLYRQIDGIGSLTLQDHPELYERLPEFASLNAGYGSYIELTAYLGRINGVLDINHWSRLVEAVKDCPNIILDFVNENDAQHDPNDRMDTNPYSKSPYNLSSHGSNGSQSYPVEPFWDFSTVHFNDAFEWWRKTGHNSREIPGCVVADENTRCPDKDSSIIHYYDSARAAAYLCAGSVFHSVHGKLSLKWPDGPELNCAIAHANGAMSAKLEFQDGTYLHHPEMEIPGKDLRVYGMKLSDGREEIIEIRL